MPLFLVPLVTWFMNLLSSLFFTVTGMWAARGIKRMVLVALYISLCLGITAAFAASLGVLSSSLAIIAPDGFADACRLILPSNLIACVSACVSARLIRFAFIYGFEMLTAKFIPY